MNAVHDDGHERVLEAALEGDPDARRELEPLLGSCERCAQEWGELGDLRRRLDASAALERAVVGQEHPEDRLREAEASARELIARAPRPPRPGTGRPRRWLALTALAAALVAGFFLWRALDQAEPERPTVMLGDERIELTAPLDAVASWDVTFTWDSDAGPGAVFRVVVMCDDGSGRVLAQSPEITERQWKPTETSAWPDRIAWQVAAQELASEPFTSELGKAWLSSH